MATTKAKAAKKAKPSSGSVTLAVHPLLAKAPDTTLDKIDRAAQEAAS
jgi:hypothetical protein